MKSKLSIVFGFFAIGLSGCFQFMDSPLDKMSSSQLSNLSTPQLCSILTNNNYKFSENGMKEFNRRGLVDCKNGELYCIGLGYPPRSPGYVNCRNQYNNMMIAYVQQQKDYQNQQILERLVSLQAQSQNAQPTTLNVYQTYQPCRGVWCANPYGTTINKKSGLDSFMESYNKMQAFLNR